NQEMDLLMRKLAVAAGLLAMTLPAQANPTLEGVASGLYNLEKTHAFLTWTVKHNGISGYTVNFTDFEADLVFDAETPENSQLAVSINPTALNTNYPDPEKKIEWENELATDARFMNANEFPAITFNSTSVEKTGDFEGKVTGDLTFLGVTKPVTLDVSYGGVANPPWFGQRDVIGFTASTTIARSDFGQTALAGVISDEVEIEFSGEFLQAAE
ncbi:MAG: YceI family protein, partial [Hyphomonas sp.]|nr:YceI family protein [Hyphomonas sp.]